MQILCKQLHSLKQRLLNASKELEKSTFDQSESTGLYLKSNESHVERNDTCADFTHAFIHGK